MTFPPDPSHTRISLWLVYLLIAVGAILVSYLFALAGEPQSQWIWRDVLGVIE